MSMTELQTLTFYRLITPKIIHDILAWWYEFRNGHSAEHLAKVLTP
jgi:hypothetical protein